MGRTRDIGVAVGRLVVAFNTKADDMRLERIATYEKGWSDIPAPLLELAVDRWIQSSKWFPKVSEIRELAEAVRRELMAANPYEPCVNCVGGWASRHDERGVFSVCRCACWRAYQARLTQLGVTSQPLALPAGKPEEAA